MTTVPCALLERWAYLMMQCNGDLNELIEIQITDDNSGLRGFAFFVDC